MRFSEILITKIFYCDIFYEDLLNNNEKYYFVDLEVN